MSLIDQVNQDNFDVKVLNGDKLILVDFWAEWCRPCKALMPTLEEIAEEMKEKVMIVKLNIDENEEIANEYKIKAIPTLILFKESEIKETMLGKQSKTKIIKTLEKHI